MHLEEGKDYYVENGLYVFTESYHINRGYCCKSGCRHCPYGSDKKIKVAVSWSGGKDSALALYSLLQEDKYEIDHLFTVFDESLKRFGLHGIPEYLIEKQAVSLGIPLKKLYLKESESHNNYEILMNGYYKDLKNEGVSEVLFGDIFLEDLKLYRDNMLSRNDLNGVYPLWHKASTELMKQFLKLGFKTVVCAGKDPLITKMHLGKIIDDQFIKELPSEVDPCGENGEYHTFVFDGPIFNKPVEFKVGEIIEKDYHYKSVDKKGNVVKHITRFLFQEIQ